MRKLVTALLLAASSLFTVAASAAAPISPPDDPTKPVPWCTGAGDPTPPAVPAAR